jgi:peptide/nickel transport system permease protein
VSVAQTPLPSPDAGALAGVERLDSVRVRQWKVFWSSPLSYLGVALLLFLILFSFVGPVVYHGNAYSPNVLLQVQPPSSAHLLGTDQLGRDELIRLMLGGQLSLIIGFIAALLTMVIGTLYGMISALAGGYVDVLLMRVLDVLYSVPILFLLLFLVSVYGASPVLLTVILAGTSWFGVARIVRSEVLSIRQREYVEAARANGANTWEIMMRHVLPNVMGVILVASTFQIAGAIIAIAGLSFLGLGLPPPTPNWGGLLSDGLTYIYQGAWWLIYPPGLCIVFVALAVNFVGDALRQAFDPRLLGG